MEFDYPLPERWTWVPLGELADTKGRAIVSGPFGSNISSKFFVDDGIPVIRGNNLTTGSQKFVDGGFVFVTPEKARELGNVDAVRDDIIFTAAGSLGQVGIIPKKTRYPVYIISNKQMRVRLNRDLIDPLFAFQWLSSAPMVEFIQRQNTGSSVPLINLSIVRRLPVPLPPLAEQRAIAAVLGALDDKIELNRRMNGTLESMARALFQSWFVDFDPVRAKLDGRQPAGLDPETAALFPDSFHDSPLGLIPRDWEVKPLSDLCQLGRGASPRPINDYMNGEVPLVKIADATAAGGPFLFETKEKVKKAGAEKSVAVVPGDLILSNSATCGVPMFVELHGCIHDGWLYFKNLRSISKIFLFHVLLELAEHLVQIADGSFKRTSTRTWLVSRTSSSHQRRSSLHLMPRRLSGLTSSGRTVLNPAPSPPCATRCCRSC
jgi:type I restriction enzyme S subunit